MYSSSINIFQFGSTRACFIHIGSIGLGEILNGCTRVEHTFSLTIPDLAQVIIRWHGIGAWASKDLDGCEEVVNSWGKVGEVWIFESGVWVSSRKWSIAGGKPNGMSKAIGNETTLNLIMSLTIAASLKQKVMDNDEESWRDIRYKKTPYLGPNSE